MDSVVVKVKYGDTVRRFTSTIASNGAIFPDMLGLRDKILGLFNFAPENDFSLKYIDEDNEKISLVDDEDLYEAFRQYLNPLRIFVKTKTVKAKARRSKFMVKKSRSTTCCLRAEEIFERSRPLTSQASISLATELVKASILIVDSLMPKHQAEIKRFKGRSAEYSYKKCEPNEFEEDAKVGEEKRLEQGDVAKVDGVSVFPIDLNLDPATSDFDANSPPCDNLEHGLGRLLCPENRSIMMERDDMGEDADYMECNDEHASTKNFNSTSVAACLKNPVVEASAPLFDKRCITSLDEIQKRILNLKTGFQENELPLTCDSEEALQEAVGKNMDQGIDMSDDSSTTSDDAKGKSMYQESDIFDNSSITSSQDAKGEDMDQEIDIFDDSSITSSHGSKGKDTDILETDVFDDHKSITSDDFDSSDVEHELPRLSTFAADDFPSFDATEVVIGEEAILNKLEEMGFSKSSFTEEILKLHEYNIEHSIDYLCGVSDWDLMLEDLLELERWRNSSEVIETLDYGLQSLVGEYE
ncbi:PB1 domain containing protein [Trema orientale]|uniref:PB1 domain containing protein n=1 Tax=Trema orientale TaxID=63057 RepID=A0A2P5FMQ2_TREOI|nr:PB1 domain containing protein [Trema orientale]